MAPVSFVSLAEAFLLLESYRVYMTRAKLEERGSQRITVPGYDVVILDYRNMGEPYRVDWVFSIEDGASGRELRRFNVRR